MRTIVDLSHPLDTQIPMFPGLPAPESAEFLSREDSRSHYTGGTTFVIHRYTLIGNSGTYLDGPFHRYADSDDLATLPLEHCVDLPGFMLNVEDRFHRGRQVVESNDIENLNLGGCALLIRTGWDKRWDSESYLDPNPYVDEAAANMLVEQGIRLVGIDTWNIDDVHDSRRPVHSILLRAGIPIIENLRGLEQLPRQDFRFHAAPLPIRTGSAIPVRAYAVIDSEPG